MVRVWLGIYFVPFIRSSSHFHHYSFLSLLFISLFLVKLEPWAGICLFTLHNVLPVVGCWCILCCCDVTTLMFCEHVLRTDTRFTATCTTQLCSDCVAPKLLAKNVYALYTCCSGCYFIPIHSWGCWDISFCCLRFQSKKVSVVQSLSVLDTTVETRCSHSCIW